MKPNKYRNKKITIQGLTFDSIAEGMRFLELQHMQARGQISGLTLQVPFPVYLVPGSSVEPPKGAKLICKYLADSTYWRDDEFVVEDVKGHATPLYRLKKKLVECGHGITITEVKTSRRKR